MKPSASLPPQLNVRDLPAALRSVRILYDSGYSTNELLHEGMSDPCHMVWFEMATTSLEAIWI